MQLADWQWLCLMSVMGVGDGVGGHGDDGEVMVGTGYICDGGVVEWMRWCWG